MSVFARSASHRATSPGGRPAANPRRRIAGIGGLLACVLAIVGAAPAAAAGGVVAWGDGALNQTTVPLAAQSGVTSVAGGTAHALALKSDGTVVGWGDNGAGRATPPAGLGSVVAVDGGASHSIAPKSDGTVVAWGSNGSGQTDVPAGLSGVTAISAGTGHNLALSPTARSPPGA